MATSPPHSDPTWLDRVAIATSAICLVHCLALPVIVAALPALGGGKDGLTHWLLLGVAVPVSVVALGRGRGAAGLAALAIGLVGLALMASGVAWFEGLPTERWLTVAGVSLVAAAHGLRWRSRHRGHQHRRATP